MSGFVVYFLDQPKVFILRAHLGLLFCRQSLGFLGSQRYLYILPAYLKSQDL